jgi:hypothetical protein
MGAAVSGFIFAAMTDAFSKERTASDRCRVR